MFEIYKEKFRFDYYKKTRIKHLFNINDFDAS